MRLVQLSYLNKKNDFDLAYSLLVAAIESIGHIAIDERKIDKPTSYNEWKKKSKSDEDYKGLFHEYIRIKQYVDNEIKHKDLSSRFVQFILEYCPVSYWEEIQYAEFIQEGYDVRINNQDLISVWEIPIEMVSPDDLKKIIKDTYNHRSKFFHEGKSAPHKNPYSHFNARFFESENVIKNGEVVTQVFLKYELMAMICRVAIINFARATFEKK